MDNKPQFNIFGEVLFDHFPDGSRVLGGAPFNVAWHLHAFNQSPRFISRIGTDPAGKEISRLMENWGMDRKAVQIDPLHPTGNVKVSIHDGEPEYEIVQDCAYDFIDPALNDQQPTEGILYHGSLATRNPISLSTLMAIKNRHQGKVFIDVNLRPPWWKRETILPLLHDAHWVKLNENEMGELCPEHFELQTAMQWFSNQLSLEWLIVTRGAQGAVALEKGGNPFEVKPQKSINFVDTVGAGDAFSATLLLGLHENWPIESTLERAQDFASAIVEQRGATVGEKKFYHGFMHKWQ